MKHLKILPLVLSLTLMVGCASSDFQASGGSSDSSVTSSDSSADDSFNQTQAMINQQAALDAANAAAQQQFNDAMAAQQLFENQHNAEFNQIDNR
jgi:hypothetical protein